MAKPELLQEFRDFAAAPRGVVEGALLVGRAIAKDFDAEWCRNELSRLASAAGHSAVDVGAYLQGQGFAGATDYYRVANSSLAEVLRERRGIPISLAMVLVGVAERCGLSAAGINFPRHFLVQIDGQLVDPFTMQLTTRDNCRAWLAANDLAEDGAFQIATALDVMLRMLNNLRLLALGQGDHAQVIELSDYQLAIAPQPLAIHMERVESWLALGVPGMARHELECAIKLAPNEALRAQLAARLTGIAGTPSSLN
jgi:regulator of sirC expression with transglutaminase-like and TPR domain